MKHSRYWLFLLYIIIFIICGLIIVRLITEKSPSKTDLFDREESIRPVHDENYIFDKAIRRLLHTHAKTYADSNAICPQKHIKNPKHNTTLASVAKLLPKLLTKIVPYPRRYYKDRGIVLTVGRNQWLQTRFNLRIIEWTRTKLPVEIWYSSMQINRTIADDLVNSVPTLKVKACCFETARCYDFHGKEINLTKAHIHAPKTTNVRRKIYSFKSAAILSSTFAEVLFLDWDYYPVRDPLYLFKRDPMYKKFGVLLYPDIYMSHQYPQLWLVLNSSCVQNEFSVDSGVLLFNKKRVWRGIYLAKLMSDNHKIFHNYFVSNGDKDTFRLAFRYLKIPYYIVGIPCSTGYVEKNSFCGVTLCKTDSLGLNIYFDHVYHPKHQKDITFSKKNFTHTRVALADPNNQTYFYGYCRLHPLPCFQVGFWAPISLDEYCKTSALEHSKKPLVNISSSQLVLWNPNVETKLLSMKKSEKTMPGYIDFYFQTQAETIFRNVKL